MYKGEQDYLKAIFLLTDRQKSGYLSNQELTKYFNHTPQSVIEMIKRLKHKGLVEYKPYKGSKLTSEGKESAIRLIRIHRLWEIFLVQHMNYQWEDVHDEAEELEHVTSRRLENALFEFLDCPEKCPHGNPIPNYDEEFNLNHGIPLTATHVGRKYTLLSLNDDPRILHFLNKHGIKLGDTFEINEDDDLNENILIKIKSSLIPIGYGIAEHIKVAEKE